MSIPDPGYGPFNQPYEPLPEEKMSDEAIENEQGLNEEETSLENEANLKARNDAIAAALKGQAEAEKNYINPAYHIRRKRKRKFSNEKVEPGSSQAPPDPSSNNQIRPS